MTNLSPFFSILIPSYNRPEYLEKTIQSILSSTFSNYEIIVSDDCSPKLVNIIDVLEKFKCNSNVSFYSQEVNIGWSENRNFLVQKATGKYIILLGDDDLLFPHTLDRLKINIDKNINADILVFGYQIIDDFGIKTYSIRSNKSTTLDINNTKWVKRIFNADILPFALFHPFTLVYKKEIRDTVRYEKEAGIGDDYLFLFDTILQNKVIHIVPEVLFSWRKIFSPSIDSHQNLSNSERNIEARLSIINILKEKRLLPDDIRIYINSPQYYKRFILDSIILNKELWKKNEIINLLSDSKNKKKLKFKINIYYLSYLKISRLLEKFFILGIFSTSLNIYAFIKRK